MFKIETNRSSRRNIDAFIMTLGDRTLRFNGKATIRLEKTLESKIDIENNLFDCLNKYVDSTFSLEKQKQLFNLYEKGFKITESGKFVNYEEDLAAVLPISNEILNLINVEKYCSFIYYSEFLKIPENLGVAASKGDYPVETTITDVDYVEMVKLAFTARVTYPLVFSLLARFEPRMGKSSSELVCGALIKGSPAITALPGWHKLKGYIEFAFNKRGTPTQIDTVTSSETFTTKVLYNTIFSRLCCAVIPETEVGKNLATTINSSVQHHETTGSRLNKKDFGDDSEDKRSLYERFQAAEMVKTANVVKQAEYFSFGLFDESDKPRYVDRFKFQCKGFGIKDEKLVEAVYDRLPPNWEFDINDHNLKLLQLTFAGHISPLVFEACEYTQLMAAIVLAQVKLSELGFKYLPSVVGMIHDPDGVRSLADGLKLDDEDKEYLTSICDIQSSNKEGRSFNEAIVAANDFLERLGNGIWKSNLEYGVLDHPEIYQRVGEGVLFSTEIEVEIKNEFMTLLKLIHN